MTLYEIVALLRGLVQLWVAMTAFSISQLYRDGYAIARRESAIISRLISILFWLSIVFGFFSVASFAQAFDIDSHESIILFAPVLLLPLGVLLNKFRNESIKQNEKEK